MSGKCPQCTVSFLRHRIHSLLPPVLGWLFSAPTMGPYICTLYVVNCSSHFNILAIVIFLFLKGVGGAEPFLATNHYKSQHIYWKYWELLSKFGISDNSSGPRTNIECGSSSKEDTDSRWYGLVCWAASDSAVLCQLSRETSPITFNFYIVIKEKQHG